MDVRFKACATPLTANVRVPVVAVPANTSVSLVIAMDTAAEPRLEKFNIAPGGRATLAFAGVLCAMSAMAAAELLRAPEVDYGRLVMGATSASCPWLIALLAIPVMVAILWAMRAMAPTRLTLAGTAAGLAAGGASAFIYAISCDESAMPFVLVWYGFGIALPAAAGAVLGNRVLRW